MTPADLWLAAANKTKRPKDPLDAFNDWQRDVLDILLKHAPDLYQGKKEPQDWSNKDIHELTRRVGASDPTTYRERILFLAKGIMIGNAKSKWNIPVNPILIKINREKNHITPARFATRHIWQPLLAAFYNDLENAIPQEASERIGQILFSAVFFGGLIDAKWLVPFLQSLTERQIFQENIWLWFEMERSSARKNSQEITSDKVQTRRWVADPLTQLLIYRYLQHNDGQGSLLPPWELIDCYLQRLQPNVNALPKSQGELLNWAFDRYTSLLPGILVGYARGDIMATSLPTAPWLRKISGQQIPVSRTDPPETAPLKRRKSRVYSEANISNAKQIGFFRELLDQINPQRLDKALFPRHGRKIFKDFLEEHQGQLSVCLQMLLGWARQLLSPRHSILEGRQKKSPLAVSSVFRYLNEIGVQLLMVCELHDPRLLDPIDLEGLYEQANLRKNSKCYNARRLKYFHGYLRVFHGLPKLDFAELFSDLENESINVDANIITPAIYSVLLETLGWNNQPDRWQKVQIIATILGYRLGLRPSEIQSLRLQDIHLGHKPELIICNSLFHQTKTFASRRRVPLSLLTVAEIDFIESFLNTRMGEYLKWGNELFLHHPIRKTGMLSDEELFEPVRESLRTLTGDQSLRFYSLRHTCFSHLTALLMLREDIDEDGCELLNNADFTPERREQIKQELFANERCGRKFTQGVALLAGHNSPRTTYKHYIHLADWMLGYHLRHADNGPQVSYKAIIKISCLSQSTVFYHLDKNKESQHRLFNIVNARAREFSKELPHPLMDLATPLQPKHVRKSSKKAPILPKWDQALTNFSGTAAPTSSGYRFAKKLPDNANWSLAEQVYTAISSLRWQQVKPLLPVIRYALIENYPGRWHSIDFKLPSKVRAMLSLLHLCGIHHRQILVIHHPRYGQKNQQKTENLNYWKKQFKTEMVLTGEESNQEKTPARGIATLVVSTKRITEERLKTPRRPRMSTGFIFALDMIMREVERLERQ